MCLGSEIRKKPIPDPGSGSATLLVAIQLASKEGICNKYYLTRP
jgi:hypothetical protein